MLNDPAVDQFRQNFIEATAAAIPLPKPDHVNGLQGMDLDDPSDWSPSIMNGHPMPVIDGNPYEMGYDRQVCDLN